MSGLRFIEKFPGRLHIELGITHSELLELSKRREFDSMREDPVFISYVNEGMGLMDIPEHINMDSSKVSGFGGDIMGTFKGVIERMEKKKREERFNHLCKNHEETSEHRIVDTNGFDVYAQAASMNADYMDMNSGRVYLIQDYNRAKSFGLPTPGIFVREWDGTIIGVAGQVDHDLY